jgi:8-oxo-dGTP diphosphatase
MKLPHNSPPFHLLQPDRLHLTLCFLTRGETVLMLKRLKAPNKGLWNGVGGRIENGETPRQCILREVAEETGYTLPDIDFAGILTWEGFETRDGGLYIYTAEAPSGEPLVCDEGELAWKPRSWVVSAPGVVSNIHVFGRAVLAGDAPRWYHFVYQNGSYSSYLDFPIPEWIIG